MSGPVQGILSVVGRLFLVTIFLMSAVGNDIPKFSDVTEVMITVGVPFPVVALSGAIAFLIVGSMSVLVGYYARCGAALLAVFLILATYYFHAFWNVSGGEQQKVMIDFMKNFALLGAMIFLIANGPGAWSLDARRKESAFPG